MCNTTVRLQIIIQILILSYVIRVLSSALQIIKCVEVDPNFKPVIDGEVLPYSASELLQRRQFPPLEYMTGTVRSEFGKGVHVVNLS